MNNITIFTDGASRGNPGPGGWAAVIVYPNGNDSEVKSQKLKVKSESQVMELGGREKHTTNNQMELTAVINALDHLPPSTSHLLLLTDSSYVINGITKWVMSWQKKNWITTSKTEVLNKKLWEKLIKVSEGKDIEWKYIGGHRGIVGNERCDEIATELADGKKLKLYSGPLEKYPLNILDFSLNEKRSKKRTKDRSRVKAPAYSYVSQLDGKIMKHVTWAECEKRVKGKSGAKFKKSISQDDEREIVHEWSKN